ncbi:MAG: hypothetical protein AB7K24_10250 [Gemmataceae bacterium]
MRCRSIASFLIAAGLLAAAAAFQAEPANSPEETLPVLAQKATFWKGNLHTHSLWSDGDDFPEMIADWYKRNGYHFLALSDHNILSQGQKWIDIKGKADRSAALKKYRQRFGAAWVETRTSGEKEQVRLKPLAEFRAVLDEPARFQLIQGEEITHRFAKAPVHMNAVNLRDLILPVNGASVAETIEVNYRAVLDQRKRLGMPMLAFLNHPNYGWAVRAEDLIAAEDLRFFEIFNGHPSVKNYGDKTHPGCERLWDIVLAQRLGKLGLPVLYGLATDDAHAYHAFGPGKSNPGRGWIMVKSPFLSPEAIVKAMEAGNFYASTGVELADFASDGKQLKIDVVPVKGVDTTIQFVATMKDASFDSKPVLDDAGKPLDVTRQYSADIGKVVSEVKGPSATYQFTGNELYVRARVVSTKPTANPYEKGDVEMAWTQPVQPAK